MRVLGALLLLALGAGCRASDPAAERELPPVVVRALEPGEAALTVCAVGDTGTGGSGQADVATSMATRAAEEPWDLVLLLGDNFYPEGVASLDDPQWEEAFEAIYDAPALRQVPFYVVLGNHDHKGSVQAQVDYSQRSARWRLPARHYAFEEVLADGTRVGFFMLDTQVMLPGSAEGEAQRTWLAEALAQSEADWKVVCGHHPIYSSKLTREGYRTHLGPFLEDTLVAGDVDLYLAGHDHVLELSQDLRGVRHVISGAGAGWDKAVEIEWGERSDYAATGGGFCVLRFTARDVTLEFVRLDGATQFASTLERAGR